MIAASQSFNVVVRLSQLLKTWQFCKLNSRAKLFLFWSSGSATATILAENSDEDIFLESAVPRTPAPITAIRSGIFEGLFMDRNKRV
jgi:hypothetical protein